MRGLTRQQATHMCMSWARFPTLSRRGTPWKTHAHLLRYTVHRPRSVGPASTNDRADGACQDAQVEEHREMLDVEQVELRVQVQRQLTAAVHLPPSRHAGQYDVPRMLPWLVPFHDPRQLRTRPHQAHLAAQHVHKLWQLVQAGAAQVRTQRRDTRVVRPLDGDTGRRGGRILILILITGRVHGAELEHVEDAAMLADAR